MGILRAQVAVRCTDLFAAKVVAGEWVAMFNQYTPEADEDHISVRVRIEPGEETYRVLMTWEDGVQFTTEDYAEAVAVAEEEGAREITPA